MKGALVEGIRYEWDPELMGRGQGVTIASISFQDDSSSERFLGEYCGQ